MSQNRRRYKKHGFDLDLTYITDRIVAMSAPAFGGHTAYRNDINVVSRFLSLRHYGSFFVYNFCDTYGRCVGSAMRFAMSGGLHGLCLCYVMCGLCLCCGILCCISSAFAMHTALCVCGAVRGSDRKRAGSPGTSAATA